MVALLNLNTNKNCEAFEIMQLIEKEKEDVVNNKVWQIIRKVFAQKFNHDRHNDIVQILILLVAALNQLKMKKYYQ